MPSFRSLNAALVGSTALLLATPAHAEIQLQGYLGANTAFSSDLTVDKGGLYDKRDIAWDGKSFEAPLYYGARGTYWFEPQTSWGVALDFTHQKAYAKLNFATDPTYDHLEFTHGNNIATLNALYRVASPASSWVYYGGAGAGLAIPHVEVTLKAYPGESTDDYQITGIAVQALAGVEYRLTQHWDLFGEGKIAYTNDDADLVDGGNVKTQIWSPQVLAGIAYRF